ncbi:LysR family transcriptional regulator [Caproicibacterium sp. NSD3]
MNFLGLSYFLIAAEEMNFTAAAQKLFITQQSLSSHIKKLENEYQVKLFERKPKLKLTPAGERMVEYSSRILRMERMMRSEFSEISLNASGTLIVGCSRLRAKYIFPEIWNEYRKFYPNIELRVVEGSSATLESYLEDRKIDICISLNILDQSSISLEKLIPEKIYCIINRELFKNRFGSRTTDMLKKFSSGISCENLIKFPLIMQPPTNIIRKITNHYFEIEDIIPKPVFESNDTEMLFNMCVSGSGVIFLSSTGLFLPQSFYHHSLERVYVFQFKDATVTPVIAWPSDPPLPHFSRVFADISHRIFLESTRKVEKISSNILQANFRQT